MNTKMKMIVGTALALSILSIAFLAAPIQAYVNGADNGDILQVQDQDRLRAQDCQCNGETLHTQQQERQKAQDCNCTCDCTQTQYHNRKRTNECATIRICNCTTNLEDYRYQYRERTRSQGS